MRAARGANASHEVCEGSCEALRSLRVCEKSQASFQGLAQPATDTGLHQLDQVVKNEQQCEQSPEEKCLVLERDSRTLQTELQQLQTEQEQLQTENKELLISKKRLSDELGEVSTQQKELQSNQKQLQHKQKQLQTELHGLQAQHGPVSQQYEAALNERDDPFLRCNPMQVCMPESWNGNLWITKITSPWNTTACSASFTKFNRSPDLPRKIILA
ncbi:hypothetical protein NU195Hw_g8995t1 [Hortaea werneckii]